MTLGNNNNNNNKERMYDYIVVGAGSAGSIVAAQLADAGHTVLVLEAGDEDNDPAIADVTQYFNVAFDTHTYRHLNWGFTSTPQAIPGTDRTKQYALPRGKVLGGTHAINAAAFVPGHHMDWDSIATTMNDPDWAWDSVVQHMNHAYSSLDVIAYGRNNQVGASDYIDSIQSVLGLSYNDHVLNGHNNGVSDSFWTGSPGQQGGIRRTTYQAYLKPLRDRGLVDVLTLHPVQRILFDEDDNHHNGTIKAIGVEAKDLRVEEHETLIQFYASADVILCAGVYKSPHLLLLSGIGPREHLHKHGVPVRVELPGVGSNLCDHFSVGTFWNFVNLTYERPFLFNSPVLNLFGPEPSGPTTFQCELAGGYASVVPLRQQSSGTVRLASTDPNDDPEIDPHALADQADFDAVIDGIQIMVLPVFSDLCRKGLLSPASLQLNATREELEEYVRTNVESNHHAVGTCKVGVDANSVVDGEGRVIGTSNLRVLDASVLPKVPSGNTNAATMAVAYVGVQKILGKRATTTSAVGVAESKVSTRMSSTTAAVSAVAKGGEAEMIAPVWKAKKDILDHRASSKQT